MAYEKELYTIVELIDELSGDYWRYKKPSKREIRLKKPLEEKIREQEIREEEERDKNGRKSVDSKCRNLMFNLWWQTG